MKRLVFVRHAQSFNNQLFAEIAQEFPTDKTKRHKECEIRREPDPGLSDIGKQQAQHVATRLAEEYGQDMNVLVASPMKRALLTQQIINNALNVPKPQLLCQGVSYEVGGLRLGDATLKGDTPHELHETWGVTCSAMPENGWHADQQKQETRREAIERARQFYLWICKLLKSTNAKNMIVVTHGDFIGILLKFFLCVPIRTPVAIAHVNTAVTTLQWQDNRGFVLFSLNDYHHLPTELNPVGVWPMKDDTFAFVPPVKPFVIKLEKGSNVGLAGIGGGLFPEPELQGDKTTENANESSPTQTFVVVVGGETIGWLRIEVVLDKDTTNVVSAAVRELELSPLWDSPEMVGRMIRKVQEQFQQVKLTVSPEVEAMANIEEREEELDSVDVN